jgi:hypothetical protein
MIRDYSILIGAKGWIHPEWEATYYPDDLPQDWQLGYYSNDFPVVMVTEKEWQNSEQNKENELENWLDNSEASLRFVVELDAEHATLATWRDRLDEFGDRLLGVVMVFDVLPTVERLKALCLDWQDDYALCMDFVTTGPGEEIIAVLRDIGIGWCWNGKGNGEGLNNKTLALARIETKDKTPRDLRAIVETMLAVDTTERKVLLFEGVPPSIEVMENTRIILDLL